MRCIQDYIPNLKQRKTYFDGKPGNREQSGKWRPLNVGMSLNSPEATVSSLCTFLYDGISVCPHSFTEPLLFPHFTYISSIF